MNCLQNYSRLAFQFLNGLGKWSTISNVNLVFWFNFRDIKWVGKFNFRVIKKFLDRKNVLRAPHFWREKCSKFFDWNCWLKMFNFRDDWDAQISNSTSLKNLPVSNLDLQIFRCRYGLAIFQWSWRWADNKWWFHFWVDLHFGGGHFTTIWIVACWAGFHVGGALNTDFI